MINILFSLLQKPGIIAIIVAIIAGIFALHQFDKEQRINRYISFIEDIDKALLLADTRLRYDKDSKEYHEISDEMDLALNEAFSKAMVCLPDEIFKKIEVLLNKDFDKKSRNRIYYIMRKDLYPNTKITFEEIQGKLIKIGR